MTRKKRKSKNENTILPVESVQGVSGLTDSSPGENVAESGDADTARDVFEGDVLAGKSSTEESETTQGNSQGETLISVEPEESSDDPLDDIRRSLVEEEQKKGEQKSKTWWRQIARGLQTEKNAGTVPPGDMETDVSPETGVVETRGEGDKSNLPEDFGDEIDGLIEALKTSEEETSEPETMVEDTTEWEQKATVDIGQLKKQAFQPRADDARTDVTEDVRSIALQGDEEILVEVQATRQNTFEERLTGIENALRPYRRYIYMGFAVLGALMVTITAIILFVLYQRLQPPEPVEETVLPYPTMLSLPGGLNFNLARGTLKDGQWIPRGPEWLEGTEICRWIAIPWSRQMEAVIRTLNSNDPIELTMSNNDQLVYQVYSVQEVRFDELQSLETDTPCLLLVLAKSDTDMRWVLTALP